MAMKTIFRYLSGYVLGIGVFMVLIPYGIWLLSSLDYALFKVRIFPLDGVRYVISVLLFILGMVFIVWSNIFLFLKGKGGPTDIAGICVSPRTQVLVTSGPYRHTRNPMVFGVHTVYFAMSIYFNSLACLVLLLLFFLIAVKQFLKTEEKRLLNDFGDDYLAYKTNTPLLWPSLWKKRRML